MSRRKQARPRLCKRDEDEDGEGSESKEDSDNDTDPKKARLSVDEHVNGKSEATNTAVGEMHETTDPEVFKCETCNAIFDNLVHFMDHRNSQCETDMTTLKSESRSESRADTPSSVDSQGSNVGSLDSVVDEQDPYQIPSHSGIDEEFPIPCQFCDKAFSKMSHLRVHEQVHADVMPYSCTQCARVFRHKRNLERHVKMHKGYKKYKCKQCDATFARSDHYKSHMKSHVTKEAYPCPICNLKYPTMAALMSHQNAHKPKPLSSTSLYDAQCMDCSSVFRHEKELAEHECNEYGGKRTFQCRICSAICVGPTALALHSEHAHSMINGEQNKCPICYKTIGSMEEMTAHVKLHENAFVDLSTEPGNGNQSDLSSIEFGSSILGNGNGLVPMDVLMCPYCLRDDFETLEHLELHMQSVHSVKPTEVYTCNYCNAPYKNLYSLHEHMRAIHQNQPSMGIKYPCSKCGKEFPSIESLQDHKKRMHHYKQKQSHTEAVYPCNFCSLSFISATSLEDHVRATHVVTPSKQPDDHVIKGSKSALSPKVNKASLHKPREGTLIEGHTIINVPEPSHILRHLRAPVKSPFQSPSGTVHHNASPTSNHVTQTSMTTSPSSGRNESTKEKITCDQCNASFTDVANYQSHVKLHLDTMLGQYACRECGKMFLSEEHLESHVSSHYLKVLAEYGCTSCNKSFNKADELQKHLMDIHAHHLYKCSLCKEIFDSKVNIQVHFAIKHSNENKLYRCVTCDSMFRTETEWQVHLRVSHLQVTKPYRCLFCKESFSTEMDLQCHLATHNKPFKCSMCDESFLVEFLLDKHIQSVHSAEPCNTIQSGQGADGRADGSETGFTGVSVKMEKDSDLINQDVTAGSSLFGSILSPSGLSGKASYNTHGALIPDSSASVFASLTASGSGGGSMVWRSPDDLYRCNICDMKFSQLTGLQNHKLQDHGVKYMSPKSPYSPTSSPKECLANGSPETIVGAFNSLHSPETSFSSKKPSSSVLQEALTSSMSLPLNIQDTNSNSIAFTEKLVSSFGEKTCLACTFCSQTFKCKSDLEKHSKIHLNTGSQKCNICDEVFSNTGVLAEHKLSHCKIQQGNNCVACKIPIKNEEQFYLHSQEHGFQGAIMQCIVCRQTLASMLELQMHGRHHFQSKTVFHTCCVCLKSFNSNENLISKLNSSGRTYYVCKPCYHGETSALTCTQCSATFESPSLLDAHVATHRKSYQCIKCQESFNSEQEIQLHVATHMMNEGNIHECNLCFVMLDSPAKLQCHLIEHTYKNSEYRCSVCGRTFISAADIQNHALDHGISSRKYGCNQCNQKFFFSAELENHVYVHRKQEEHFMIGKKDNSLVIQPLSNQSLQDIEDKTGGSDIITFNQKKLNKSKSGDFTDEELTSFTKYNRLVSSSTAMPDKKVPGCYKESDIQCSKCPKIFSDSIDLQNHFFTTHAVGSSESVRKRPVCMECGKECSSESNLLTHLNTHIKGSKISCPTCDRMFLTSATLAQHLKFSCGQKQYECPICHKIFGKKSSKMEHLKSHSGDKVYTCPQCGKLFPNRSIMQEHMETHPNISQADSNEDETHSHSGASEQTSASTEQSSEEELSDPEKEDKQEVTSTSNLPEEPKFGAE